MSKNATPIWFPFYGKDFLAATMGWTAEEVGHYVRLLVIQWEQGGLPADVASLNRVSPGIKKSWKKLEEKFPISDADGLRRNERLEREKTKAAENKERRSTAGKTAAKARWDDANRIAIAIANAMADAMPKDMRSECSSPSPVSSPAPDRPALRFGRSDEVQSTHTTHADGVDVPGQDGGGWALREWVAFVQAWNRTERAVPWTPLTPPDGWVDVAASPGWLDRARSALDHLPRCQWFTNPLAVTRFLSDGYVDRILAGEFDQPKQSQSRNGRTGGKPLPDPTVPPF